MLLIGNIHRLSSRDHLNLVTQHLSGKKKKEKRKNQIINIFSNHPKINFNQFKSLLSN